MLLGENNIREVVGGQARALMTLLTEATPHYHRTEVE